MEWAWSNRQKILFFPDQHLGENTALAMGIPESDMIFWNPDQRMGGNTPESIASARLILWKGFCSVHQLFKLEHALMMRKQHPGIEILAHPECSRAVCETADFTGSTEAIIQHVAHASPGQAFAIGTELNLVNRLRLRNPNHPIYFLSPTVSMCSTMFRTDPQHLYSALLGVSEGRVSNRVRVADEDKRWAKISLDRMLSLG